MSNLMLSLRLTLASAAVCCVAYPLAVWCFAQVLVPNRASGQLLRDASGRLLGSRLIGQPFRSDRYFHGRPDGDGHGSNLSPASPELRKRIEAAVAAHGATAERPLPAELAFGSASGLDPHITVAGAKYQVSRIAAARKLPAGEVEALVARKAFRPCPLSDDTLLVNVLELNLALDELHGK